jgi:hypothetical protein
MLQATSGESEMRRMPAHLPQFAFHILFQPLIHVALNLNRHLLSNLLPFFIIMSKELVVHSFAGISRTK